MANEDQLLAKLDEWLARQKTQPTIFEVIETGDGELIAAFVLKGFRSAARDAVLHRLDRAGLRSILADGATVSSAVFRVFDRLAVRWQLDDAEKLGLLDIASMTELENLRSSRIEGLPTGIIERLAILLDIFKAINTLIPDGERADAWIRKSNNAALFKGRSALHLMNKGGLDGLRAVRRYLQAQAGI